MMTESLKSALLKAIQLAQSNDWEGAHQIVQAYSDDSACWIHAVLHKIEGDEENSRYWYRKCKTSYEDFLNANEELNAILEFLN
jgi:hypothetical protein